MNLDLSEHDQFHLEIWVYLEEKEVINLGFGTDKRTKYPTRRWTPRLLQAG